MPLPSFVLQEVTAGAVSLPASGVNVAMPKASAAGNILYGFVRGSFNSGAQTIGDAAGNSWTPLFSTVPCNALFMFASVWRAVSNGFNAGNIVGFGSPGSINTQVFVIELKPLYSGSLSAHTSFTSNTNLISATTSDGNLLSVPLDTLYSQIDLFEVSILAPVGAALGFVVGGGTGVFPNPVNPNQLIDSQFVSGIVCSAASNPQILLTGGNFQDALGHPLANGHLIIRLSQDSFVASSNVQLYAGKTVRIPLDNNGTVASNTFLWATDQMTPSTSQYIVTAYSSLEQLSWGPHRVTLPSTSPLFNISNWIPN